ncbi:hypothetical protein PBOI14_68780 [Pseudomonas sp. Boi14]|nr:hypothetical protein PBOI14_68780 [Pseudomonas sp. Boi14]
MGAFQSWLKCCVVAGSCASSLVLAAGADGLQRVKVDLVAPPQVHVHEQAVSGPPKVVQFRMNVEEKKMVVDDQGTTLQAMTFNGSMPGRPWWCTRATTSS